MRGGVRPSRSASARMRSVASMPSMQRHPDVHEHDVGSRRARRARRRRRRRPPRPTNSRSGWDSTSMRMPARNRAWSSTSATRMRAHAGRLRGWRAGCARATAERRTVVARRSALSAAAGELRALAHAGDAVAAVPCDSAVAASARIAFDDLELDAVRRPSASRRSTGARRVAVAEGVRERPPARCGRPRSGGPCRAPGARPARRRARRGPAARTLLEQPRRGRRGPAAGASASSWRSSASSTRTSPSAPRAVAGDRVERAARPPRDRVRAA